MQLEQILTQLITIFMLTDKKYTNEHPKVKKSLKTIEELE